MARQNTKSSDSREAQDSKYNPAEQAYNEQQGTFTTADFDQMEAYANDPKNHKTDTDAVRDLEEDPEGPVQDGYYRPGGKGKKQKITAKGFFKKNGALMTIIGIFFAGGAGLSIMFAPGLGIVQLKEIMTEDLNDQLAAMELGTDAMWRTRLKNMQAGGSVCSDVIKIRCKFQTMGEKQIKKFEDAKFKVQVDEIKIGQFTRYRITSLETPNGIKINNPQDLINAARTNRETRSALNRVFNPGFESTRDSIASKVLKGRFKTSKAEKLTGTTTEELDESMAKNTTGDLPNDQKAPLTDSEGKKYFIDPATGDPVYEGSDRYNQILADIGEFGDKVNSLEPGTKAVGGVFTGALKGVSVLGAADSACTVYNMARAVAAAAKMTRSIQLAQYAMVFLTTADQIKAGTATPEQVEYLGNIMSATDTRKMIYDELGASSGGTVGEVQDNLQARENPFYGKSGFDSPGYAVAAYNDAPTLTTRSQQYMVGGGLSGTLSSVTDSVAAGIGGSPENIREACGMIQNFWVRSAGLVIGVIAAVGSFGATTVLSIGASVAISFALPFLESALADIIAGTVVGPSTKGVDAGDAMFAGSAVLMGGLAQARGLRPLQQKNIASYLAKNNEVNNQYIAQARYEARSTPWDIMNQHSFLGSFARTLYVPYTKSTSSVAGAFSSLGSIFSTSLGSLVSDANAATGEYNPKRFTKCTTDGGYNEIGLDAADVFCNIRYGLSDEEIAMIEEEQNEDGLTAAERVAQYMYDNKHINDEGLALSTGFRNFMQYCVNRDMGWGETGEEASTDWTTGKACLEASAEATEEDLSNFRVYRLFMTTAYAMDEEEVIDEDAPNAPAGGGTGGAVASPVSPAGRITDGFGPRVPPCGTCSNWHQATDFVSPDGAVFAMMDGVVVGAGGGGNNIMYIRHADGLISSYWHMPSSSYKVQVGQAVTAGQQIGVMGDEGQAAGVHVHVELDISGVADRNVYLQYEINTGGYNPGMRVNPEDFLRKNGVPGF